MLVAAVNAPATSPKSRTRARCGRSVASEARQVLDLSRRATIFSIAAGSLGCHPALGQAPRSSGPFASSSAAERCAAQLSQLAPGVCYAQQGPLLPLELPRLEHTCTSCFPACVGDKCLLSISVTYPKGGSLLGLSPPYPLALISGGFTVSSAAYRSTAARLASWGYTVVRYNTRDALPDVLDDVTCVKLLRELIDWAATHPLMRKLADTSRVYAVGHSRGGKLAALTAAADGRVAALCLMDPVDVTQYAPLSDRFPSAAAALEGVAQTGRFLPVAVVGSGQAGDCAPQFNNFHSFFQASPSAAWEVLLPAAGHFQYLDSTTALQRAVCGGGQAGAPEDAAVRAISQAALVAWGEAMVKLPGSDVLSCLAARCSSITAHSSSAASYTLRGHDSVRNNSSSSDVASGWLPPPADAPLQALLPFWQTRRQQQQQPLAGLAVAGEPSSSGSSSLRGQHVQSQTDLRQQRQVQPLVQALQQAAAQQEHKATSSIASSSQPLPQQQQQQQQLYPFTSSQRRVGQLQPQQQQQQLSSLPFVQTRQEVWASSHAPSPAVLRGVRAQLEQLMVAVSHQSAAAVEVKSTFRNFG